MADGTNIPAWIALFTGLYALSAAIGEISNPGTWARMIDDLTRSSGLRFVTGILLIGLGAAIYLASPWRPDDWLAILATVIGGGMVAKGVLFLAFGEPFLRLAQEIMKAANRAWAMLSGVMGIALIALAALHL